MKIAVAQTRPVAGDIAANIINHSKLIDVAGANNVDIIVFPELSLTGYEPALAAKLATAINDHQFDVLDNLSSQYGITIAAGMPIKKNGRPAIGLIIFPPNGPRTLYTKHYLHIDEEPFFVRGDDDPGLIGPEKNIALSICYELSIPEHSAAAAARNARYYISSSAKAGQDTLRAAEKLRLIASDYNMITLFSNCLGPNDNFFADGSCAVWHENLHAKLNQSDEGILVFDSSNNLVTTFYV
jgi:predicted amidohydrolase